MARTVQYASSRREIWSWYWRAWRSNLWKFHVTLFVGVSAATLFVLSSGISLRTRDIAFAFVAGLASIAWLPIYPLLQFKPETRTLTIDERGISTVIGKNSAFRAWGQIKSVLEKQGAVVITGQNKNAFIIPRRAFDTEEAQKDFLKYARSAFRDANPSSD